MKIKNFPKLLLSVSLAISVVACSENISPISLKPDQQIQSKTRQGILRINLKDILNPGKQKFSVKKFDFNSGNVQNIKVSVYSVDEAGNVLPTLEKITDKVNSSEFIEIAINEGNNKVISIESRDSNDVTLTKFMAATNIVAGTNTTLKINYGTFPLAMLLKRLMENSDKKVRKFAQVNEFKKFETLMGDITGYDPNTNSYGGVHPSFVNIDSIISDFEDHADDPKYVPGFYVSGHSPDEYVPSYKTGKLDKEIKGKLRIRVDNGAGTLLKNFKITINDLTAKNIDNTADETTTIEDLSSGKWEMRISGSDDGKNFFIKRFINVTDGKVIVSNKEDFSSTIDVGPNDILTLVKENIGVRSIEFEDLENGTMVPDIIYLGEGQNINLKAIVIMEDDTENQSITWETSDSTVVNVGGGSVNALSITDGSSEKTATIVAKATDDLTKTTKVITIKVVHSDTGEGPRIDSFSPASGTKGTVVVIKGTNFDENPGATEVWFNDVKVPNADVSVKKEEIKAKVPDVSSSSTNSKIMVKTSKGNNIHNNFFYFSKASFDSRPSISSFSPTSGAKSTSITISGNNFNSSSDLSVSFKNLKTGHVFSGSNLAIGSSTSLTVDFPDIAGVDLYLVTVSSSKGSETSTNYFSLTTGATDANCSSTSPDTNGMVYIQAVKEFNMGHDGDDDDDFDPKHKVSLRDFLIDRNEITNSQFSSFVSGSGYSNQCLWSVEGWQWKTDNDVMEPLYWNDTRFNRPNQPVVGVSWYEAEAFARYKGRRLPTEAEWEYASRGKDERIYPWGGDEASGGNKKANGFFGTLGKEDGFQYTADVGSFTGGDSYFGLRDMSGNAYEWVNDWYNDKYYSNGPSDNPQGPGIGGSKSLRGGSWYNHPAFENETAKINDSMKSYSRFYSSPANRSNYIGFRTAK